MARVGRNPRAFGGRGKACVIALTKYSGKTRFCDDRSDFSAPGEFNRDNF